MSDKTFIGNFLIGKNGNDLYNDKLLMDGVPIIYWKFIFF